MKKTYVKPEATVFDLAPRDSVCGPVVGSGSKSGEDALSNEHVGGFETDDDSAPAAKAQWED